MSHGTSTPGFCLLPTWWVKAEVVQGKPGRLSLFVPPPATPQDLTWRDQSHGQSWGDGAVGKGLVFGP